MSSSGEESLNEADVCRQPLSDAPVIDLSLDIEFIISNLKSCELLLQEDGIKSIHNIFTARAHLSIMSRIRNLARESFENVINDYERPGERSINRDVRYGTLLLVFHIIQSDKAVKTEPLFFDVKRFSGYFATKLFKCFGDEDRVGNIAVNTLLLIGEMRGSDFYRQIKEQLFKEVSVYFSKSGVVLDFEKQLEEMLIIWEAELDVKTGGSEHVPALISCLLTMKKFCFMFKTETIEGNRMDRKIVAIAMAALKHDHVRVRESGFQLCSALMSSNKIVEDLVLGYLIVGRMVAGMTDMTSVIRMTSCSSVKTFLSGLSDDHKEYYYPIILPPMCLSRYYTADAKFMLQSRKFWKDMMGTEGILYVTKYMHYFVDFYVKSLKHRNRAVKAAAATCIGELASKIGNDEVKPYVPRLLDSVESVIKIEGWEDGDEAILALGKFVVEHSDECLWHIEDMFEILLTRLGSPDPLGRQGASSTISRIVGTYSDHFLERTMEFLVEILEAMIVKNTTGQTVADGETVISELSLANPPAKRILKPKKWHLCDGALYLIGELAGVKAFEKNLILITPLVLNFTENRSYKEHFVHLETVCKIIPLLYFGLGKSKFKEHLEKFLGVIFYLAELKNLSSSYAFKCLDTLAKLLGPNILIGRVKAINPKYLQYCKDFPPV